MEQEELLKLPHGLYKVYWKSGGKSLASIGSMPNGDRWIAVCNWINGSVLIKDLSEWSAIKKVKLIES